MLNFALNKYTKRCNEFPKITSRLRLRNHLGYIVHMLMVVIQSNSVTI